jgi:hypothetical protein
MGLHGLLQGYLLESLAKILISRVYTNSKNSYQTAISPSSHLIQTGEPWLREILRGNWERAPEES